MCIIKAQFYLLQSNLQGNLVSNRRSGGHWLWGYDLDKEFRLFLELCPSTAALGLCLLQYCDALKVYRKFDSKKYPNPEVDEEPAVQDIFQRLKVALEQQVLSHKKQNTICVELLIKAHDCFVHECYMEGIVWVLHRTKVMNTVLANAKSWSLIVKMLMGIGRYRDMYYCFETLIKHDQFESLLGQFDDDRIHGLKQAIISYLNENYPENTDNYRLAALHFLMYKEIAQMWESEAKAVITKIVTDKQFRMDVDVVKPTADEVPALFYLKCSSDLATLLGTAMNSYAHAAENYLLDNKLALAQRTAHMAELIALQINLVNVATRQGSSSSVGSSPTTSLPPMSVSCISVVNIELATTVRHLVINELR